MNLIEITTTYEIPIHWHQFCSKKGGFVCVMGIDMPMGSIAAAFRSEDSIYDSICGTLGAYRRGGQRKLLTVGGTYDTGTC